MLCRQTFGAVLSDVIGVRNGRRLGRLGRAIVELMVVRGRLDVDGRLPVVVQVPQRRRPDVMGRRRHLLVVGDSRFLFHHFRKGRAAEATEPAQDSVVDVAVDVLDDRYLVDLNKTDKNKKHVVFRSRTTIIIFVGRCGSAVFNRYIARTK